MMEHAIDLCELPCQKTGNVLYAEAQRAHCDDSPVRAWDQAVAYYAGSLEGESGLGEGILFFGLADEMCARFLTCGDDASLRFGVSYVNNVAISQFMKGQINVLKRECEQARQVKDTIVDMMAVPLVQATLLMAYEQVYGVNTKAAEQPKLAMQGTAYAATILPLVHDCSPNDAQIIFDNLLFGRDEENQTKVPDFVKVKHAFERNYRCMGISCKDVGGIWQGRDYYPNAYPCQDDEMVTEQSSSNSFRIIVSVATIGGALTLCVLLHLVGNRRRASLDRYEGQGRELPENNGSFPDGLPSSREID